MTANKLPNEIPQSVPTPKSKVQLGETDPFVRPGNRLPTYLDPKNATTAFERHSMLYSYANTVESSYTGDFRHYVKKFGEYLTTKAAVYDPIKNVFKAFDVKYAAPNLVFSDNMPNPSTGQDNSASLKDRIVLPIISYHLTGTKRDSKRAIDPSMRYKYKPKDGKLITSLSGSAPIPLDYTFQVDIWTETREHFYQIMTAFQSDFNPYSYLTDLHDYTDETQKTGYIPYAKMTLDSWTDNSNYIPGTERRVVRGTLNITVNGWLTVVPKDIPYFVKPNILMKPVTFASISEQTPLPLAHNFSFIYFGSSILPSLSAEKIQLLTKIDNVKFTGTYLFPTHGYKYFAYPAILGNVLKIIDTETLIIVPLESPYIVSISLVDYKVYRSTNILGAAVPVEVF